MRKYLLLLFGILILSSSVNALDTSKFDFDYPEPSFDNNTAFVNSTASWVTPSLGILTDVNGTQHESNGGMLNIRESWLTTAGNTLWCALTGCTMAGDIDMGTNDINNINDVNILNDLDVGDNVEIHGSTWIDEILNVTGETYLYDNLIVDGDITANEFNGDWNGSVLYCQLTNNCAIDWVNGSGATEDFGTSGSVSVGDEILVNLDHASNRGVEAYGTGATPPSGGFFRGWLGSADISNKVIGVWGSGWYMAESVSSGAVLETLPIKFDFRNGIFVRGTSSSAGFIIDNDGGCFKLGDSADGSICFNSAMGDIEYNIDVGTGAHVFTERIEIQDGEHIGLGTFGVEAQLYSDGNSAFIDLAQFKTLSIGNDFLGASYVNFSYDGNIIQGLKGNATINLINGEMFYHNHTATELSFAVDSYYYHMFMTNVTHLNGFVGNNIGFGLNSSLMAQVDGLYELTYSAIGDGQNNHVYISSIFINEVNQENCDDHKKMSAGGDVVKMSGDCFIDLNVYDNVSLRVADVGSTGTGNYYGGNLKLLRSAS